MYPHRESDPTNPNVTSDQAYQTAPVGQNPKMSVLMPRAHLLTRPLLDPHPHQADEYSRMFWEVKKFPQVMLISPYPCDCSGTGTVG